MDRWMDRWMNGCIDDGGRMDGAKTFFLCFSVPNAKFLKTIEC